MKPLKLEQSDALDSTKTENETTKTENESTKTRTIRYDEQQQNRK
jgi:hypothetical protein